jgi:penicillin-binding protein 1A
LSDHFPDNQPGPPPEPPEPGWTPPQTWRADLPRARKRRWYEGGWIKGLLLTVLVLGLVGAGGALWIKLRYLSGLPALPRTEALMSANAVPGMTFLDRNGRQLAVRGPRHGRKVRLSDLPAYVPKAFLAVEDRRFYEHGPIDWQGAARALWSNWRAGAVVQGGSTLTQQLARTIFLKPDRSFERKVREAALAVRLERRLSKDAILELYLNRLFFGAEAYGIDAAAQTYFGKPASSLSLSEAALLAALPKAPSRLSPVNDMPGATARSHLVLERMAEQGWITPAQKAEALAHPPVLVSGGPEDEAYGYVLDLAQAQAARLAGTQAPDLVVHLAIDPAMQTAANQVVREVIASQGGRAGARQAALVALGPDGSVRAIVGGIDHRISRINRAVQAQRPPGSAFKTFVYAAALETGVQPTDTRQDAPVRLGPWSPQNYAGGYRGSVTVQDALARSINTVAVRLAREVGPRRIGELSARFGLKDIPAEPGLSVALGAYEVNLLELASAYQVFQQDGRRIEPSLIEEIDTSSGQVLWRRPPIEGRSVYDAARAGTMVRMLKAVITSGTGRRAAFGRPAAGKTGTSQLWRDAWFVGFTPDWLCGVWVGDDDNRPMSRVAGGDVPAEIWRRFMLAAHQGLPPRDFPFLGETTVAAAQAAPDSAAPAARSEARQSFYQSLSSEFATADPEAEQNPEPARQ